MPYSPQSWADGPGGGTPVSAARLAHIESGLDATSDVADGAATAAAAAQATADAALTPAEGNAAYQAVVRPEAYGAVGDGTTDDTTALASWVAALNTSGGRGYLTPGKTYKSTAILHVTGNDVTIDGYGAAINLVDDGTATGVTLHVDTCSRFTLRGVKITQTAAARTGTYGLVFLDNVTDAKCVDIHTVGGSSTGFFTIQCTRAQIIRPVVESPKADGIHISRGTVDSVVDTPTVIGAADDGVAVVSVKQDGAGPIYAACRGIRVLHPIVRSTVGATGSGVNLSGATDCSVVGGFVDSVPGQIVVIAQQNTGGVMNPARNTVTGLIGTNSTNTNGSVRVGNADQTVLAGLLLSSNDQGIEIINSTRTMVTGCRVASTGTGAYGVYDDSASARTIVSGCVLDANTTGATLFQGTGSTATADNITA